MVMKTVVFLTLSNIFFISLCHSKENINQVAPHSTTRIFSNCSPSVSTVDLDIGNVRAAILMNGDMWWDLVGNARYEVPKNSGKYSLFAGALWIGGEDAGGTLKVA